MADDDALVKKITRPSRADVPPCPTTRSRPRCVERFPGAVFVESTASRSSTSTARWSPTSRAFLRDEQQFTMCVDVTARRPSPRRRARAVVAGVARRAVRGRRQLPVAPAQPPDPRRSAEVPADDPTVAVAHAVYPGANFPEREVVRPVRHRRSTAIPTSRASSCPTTGTGHPLRKDDAAARVPVTFKGDPSPR